MKKKRNMMDVPLSWYQSVNRRLSDLERRHRPVNHMAFILEQLIIEASRLQKHFATGGKIESRKKKSKSKKKS